MFAVFSRLRSLMPVRADLEAARRQPGRDLLAGVTVAIIALPLALAFGVSSGMGAEAGMVTAVIAGLIAAIFGGSNLQVSGPTGAMAVVLVPVVHQFGASGVLMVGLLAGVVLIGLAWAGMGRYVKYLPVPVIEGFTAGIAVVIALQQVPAALGVTPGESERVWMAAGEALIEFASAPGLAAPAAALGVAAAMLAGARRWPGVPFSILAVAAITAISSFGIAGFGGLQTIGTLPAGLPAPSASFVDFGNVSVLATAVIAVAALAALESLLSATVADGMSVGQSHDPDRELFGQGLANVAVPFFGGIPATAAIARTAVNVRAGAVSKLAAASHSLVLLAMMMVAATLVSRIPLAALAGVLLATTFRMVEVGSLRALMRSTSGDATVLMLTFGVTVVFDLIAAVVVGLGVAVVFALRSVARSARVERMPLDTRDHSREERELFEQHIIAYRLDGPLFFAGAHQFLLELTEVTDVRVVILRMARVSTIDATGATVLGDAIDRLEKHGVIVLISGIDPDHDEVLAAIGAAEHLKVQGRIFETTPEAISFARRLVLADPF